MTKLNVNIHDAKTNLSKYLRRVQKGQTITLCKNGKPIAELVPVSKSKKKVMWDYFGIAKDMIGKVPENFNDPLTDEELPGFGL